MAENPRDVESLVLKALVELTDTGMSIAEASGRVEEILTYLEAIL